MAAPLEGVAAKIATAKGKKDEGDAAFKTGDVTKALQAYHTAVLYLTGLDKNALASLGMAPTAPTPDGEQKERTEIDEILEKIYANMSACHIKKGNWKRAVETADKALAKNAENFKALFRKGKALGEQGFYEKAEKVLNELKTKNPSDEVAITAELSRLKAIDLEREKKSKQQWKGFLNKAAAKEAGAS